MKTLFFLLCLFLSFPAFAQPSEEPAQKVQKTSHQEFEDPSHQEETNFVSLPIVLQEKIFSHCDWPDFNKITESNKKAKTAALDYLLPQQTKVTVFLKEDPCESILVLENEKNANKITLKLKKKEAKELKPFEQIEKFKHTLRENGIIKNELDIGNSLCEIAALGCEKTMRLALKKQGVDLLEKEEIKYQYTDYDELIPRFLTPLHVACAKGHIQIVQILLEYPEVKANLNIRDKEDFDEEPEDGYNPFHIAIKKGHTEIVAIFLRLPEILNQISSNAMVWNPENVVGYNVIHLAIISNNEETLKLLWSHPQVQKKIDINEETFSPFECDADCSGGYNVLHFAIASENIKLIEFILSIPETEKSLKVSEDVSTNPNPIQAAAITGNKEIVNLVLMKAKNCNMRDFCYYDFINYINDYHKMNIFHAAAAGGNVEIMKLFFKKGRRSMINKSINWHDEGLDLLCLKNNKKSMLHFYVDNLRHNTTMDGTLTPLCIAVITQNKPMINFLLGKYTKNEIPGLIFDSVIPHAMVIGDIQIIETLEYHQNYFKILHAVKSDKAEALKWTIKKYPNANINAKDDYGRTPLIMASYFFNTEIFKELLDHPDVDVNAKDDKGQTVLHFLFINYKKFKEADRSTWIEYPCEYPKDYSFEGPKDYSQEFNMISSLILQHPNIDLTATDNQGKTFRDMLENTTQ